MGQDKVLLELDGKTFIERIYLNALEYFQRIIISTDSSKHAEVIKSLPVFKDKDIEIVVDRYDALGPMGGIRSVFEASDVQRFSIISVDVPLADMRVLNALWDRCDRKAAWLKIGDGRPEPLIAAYDRTAYEDIRDSLDAGFLKMRQVLPEEDVVIVADSDIREELSGLKDTDIAKAFSNCNTPEEYMEIMNPV